MREEVGDKNHYCVVQHNRRAGSLREGFFRLLQQLFTFVRKCEQFKPVALRAVVLGLFFVGLFLPQLSAAQVTLSGTVYSDAGMTPQAVSKFIAVAVGTSTPSVFSTTTLTTTGAWTVTIPAGHGIGTSTPIMVWVNDDVTFRATVLTKASSSASVQSITGLNLYQDRVIVRHEAVTGTSTRNADFSFYTSVNDSDLQHNVSSGRLTITAPNELYVWGGDTFAPGNDVVVQGNANASDTDGSMYIATSSIYTAGGNLTLGGSLRAASTATFTGGSFITFFNATTTGKVIDAPIASIGNVTFNGVGGEWTFQNAATTTALTILQGTVVAPSTTLGVTGVFQNDATFTHNGGTLNVTGAINAAADDIAAYIAGRDTSGSAAGTQNLQINDFAISNNGQALYAVKAGNATACSNVAGSAVGCELLVFNISSTTNPQYIAGLDVSGSAAGTGNLAINTVFVSGNYLYVGKAVNATACSNVAGSALGCELMVFDISSTTNPVYVVGRDSSGSAAGVDATTAVNDISANGNYLYLAKGGSATACSQTAGSAVGCELMVFDISSGTNPIYVAGRDASGSAAGTGNLLINRLEISQNILYAVKAGNATACSNVAGSALGCELMVFDISSGTNPIYVAGRDASGSNTGTGNSAVSALKINAGYVYIGKSGDVTPCSNVAGSALGCELMVFDISSTTNPLYMSGSDGAGNVSGQQSSGITRIYINRNYIYTVGTANASACSQVAGWAIGCEVTVFDISSSTALRMIAGRDAGGDSGGVQSLAATAIIAVNNTLYVAKAGSATACSNTPGSAIGCELMVFNINQTKRGFLMGNLTGSSTLNNFTASGTVEFRDSASTTDFSITSGTTTAPRSLTVTGNYANNGIFTAGEGTLYFSSTSDQLISGNLTSTSSLNRVVFAETGIKTISNNASTSIVEIQTGATVVAPTALTVADSFINNGTFTAGAGTVFTRGFLNGFSTGISAGGSVTDIQGVTVNAFVQKGTTLYVAKAGSATACNQTAGSAIGCELLVFNVASTTNPIFVAGRDVDGSTTGTGNLAIQDLAIAGDTLYVAKAAAGTTACANTTGAGAAACELMMFNIASTTNPLYTKGIDATGSNAGTSTLAINRLLVSGTNLYVAKAGSTTACSQIAGVAGGCELMVFNIASTSDPVYAAGRDADGTAAGVTVTAATGLAVLNNALYLSKAAAGAVACTTQANCELMVFNIASTTNPLYVTGLDVSGNAAGTQSLAINNIAVSGARLYAVKAGSATTCSSTPGSGVGCEIMVFGIASTTNPIYRAGIDVSASVNAGAGNQSVNNVVSVGNIFYAVKSGTNAACSQNAGSALGCEVIVYDTSSSTNPTFMGGLDADGTATGQTATVAQSLYLNDSSVFVGKAAETTVCELEIGLRTGCEVLAFKVPTVIDGSFVDTSSFATVTSNGLTQMLATASTTQLIMATSTLFTAPSTTLSVAGDFLVNGGAFFHNSGNIFLSGTNQLVSANINPVTFYDFTQVANDAATTTFSVDAPFVILNKLTLQGAATSTPLKLRSASSTGQWQIDPQSSTTVSLGLLDVQYSNNISATATPLVCGAGCLDSGNNSNWTIGLLVTVSGILYAEDGITPYATATPLRLVVPLASTYFGNATSATTTGAYSFSVADQFLVAGYPYIVYADNTTAIKANTIMKGSISGAAVSGLDLFRNHVIMRSQTTSTPLTNADLFKYTSVDDADIQYSLDNSYNLRIASPNALVVGDNSSFAPGNTVTISGVATTTPTVGSLYLRDGARYSPTSRTTLAGSFRASSTAQYTPSLSVLEFNATTTGKVIDSQLPTLGNVMFNGTSGSWTFTQVNATTSDFDIERGSVTAPSGTLIMNGVFTNNATFSNNNATLRAVGNTLDDNDRAATFVAGRDNQGRNTGNAAQSIEALLINGNYLYRGTNSNGNACAQTAGTGVVGCDLAVFDISSTTNPIYRAGRDADGTATGTTTGVTFKDFKVSGNYLFVANTGSSTACGQTPGSAIGCELQVYNISSSTNPVYIAGRDADGSSAGTSAIGSNALDIVGNYLYLGKAGTTTACSQTAGSASGCELMVFDISVPTNPVYVAGRDASGSNTGTGGINIEDMVVQGNNLYVAKFDDNTACNQTAGSAIGCEIMIFSIASTTNPVLVRALDVLGTDAGILGRTINSIDVRNDIMVIGKDAGGAVCEQSPGFSHGCEIVIFSIASSTNPVYVAGRDITGDDTGIGSLIVSEVTIHGNNLYVGKEDDATPCSQVAGQATGCEFMVFDISSTTNPVYVAGRDNSGSKDGILGRTANEIVARDNVVYVGKNGSTVNCAQTTVGNGAIGCELMVYQSYQPSGVLGGNLTATNALRDLVTQNRVSLTNNASTTNITIATSSTLNASVDVTLPGDFITSGTFVSSKAGALFASSSATQTFTGSATSSSTFGDIIFGGSGTKNLNFNATATVLTALSAATVNYSGDLTIEGKYTNNGTIVANQTGELILSGNNQFNNYIAGRDVSGSAAGAASTLMGQMIRRGDYLYFAKGFNAAACAQTAGSAQGCELLIFDVSSSTNPVFIAGRDSTGDSSGTGAIFMDDLLIVGDTLFVTKDNGSTACSQTAGSAIGCELMVFDISSSTNPVYVAGRDASGSAAGTADIVASSMAVTGTTLYMTKSGNATACSQTAGSAIGCELMVFDISNTTNPVYVAGRDASGSNAGTGSIDMEDVQIVGNKLYVSKNGDATACSQTAGSAIGCELMVFDISSTTNPIYIAGRDASGDSSGTDSAFVRHMAIKDTTLFMAKELGDATPCSQTAGSSTGCEMIVFDISSTTNPVYVAGRDASGDSGGSGAVAMRDVKVYGNNLYVTKLGDATACSQTAGAAIGCEFMAFDISSTTNPIYIAGRDASGNQSGTVNQQTREIYIYGTNLYLSKNGDGTACSQNAGSAIGCEFMIFNIGSILQGNMTGASAHQAVSVRGPAEWYQNASTTDLSVATTGIATLPPQFSLAGNFSNNGQFDANAGTVTLLGTNQTLTTTATTTFNNFIQIATTSATTSFGSTGGFVTLGQLRLQGTSSDRLKLRSTVDGSQWNILPQGTASTSYLDVKDSRNSSTTILDCTNNCIDRGNNTNWLFFSALGTGTTTLTQHTGGQVNNKFGIGSSTDETLLAFRLVTDSGSTTYQSLVFDLSGVSGIAANAINNFRLVYDKNNNRVYDGGDVLVGGAGDVSGVGQDGTVAFYEPFTATTSQNYLVIADWSPLNNGSFFTIGISPSGINAVDSTGAQTVLGSKVSVQHSRNNRGAGGGGASIGGGAPAGDGDVGGGDTTGGELIGNDPDFFGPSSNSGSWSNGAFAYDGVDGTYASTSSAVNHSYTNHGFVIPVNNVIGGIEIKLELSGSTAAGTVAVQLSWDGGTSWTSSKTSPTLTTTDAVRTLGSPSDLWGRSWTASELNNTNFAVRIAGNPSSNSIRLDAIQVRIYHVTGGGGSGGGGGGGGI